VREHDPVRVASREFPCLSGGPLSATEAKRDINSFLDEELPGSGLFGAVDPAAVNAIHGPTAGTGARAAPLELEPRATYVAEIYERAQKHLQDYYRSQGSCPRRSDLSSSCDGNATADRSRGNVFLSRHR